MTAEPLDLEGWKARAQRILEEKGLNVEGVVIPMGETPEDVQARLEQQARNKAASWLNSLPIMYRQADLNALEPEQHGDDVRGWLDSDSVTLVLAGKVGAGKTYAAYAVGNEAVRRGLHVAALTVFDLLEAARPEGNREALHNAQVADLLVLDDLNATRVSDFAIDTLTHLLDRRLRESKRNVVTTNATAEEIEQAWGARLLDRLNYRWTVKVFQGSSKRAAW